MLNWCIIPTNKYYFFKIWSVAKYENILAIYFEILNKLILLYWYSSNILLTFLLWKTFLQFPSKELKVLAHYDLPISNVLLWKNVDSQLYCHQHANLRYLDTLVLHLDHLKNILNEDRELSDETKTMSKDTRYSQNDSYEIETFNQFQFYFEANLSIYSFRFHVSFSVSHTFCKCYLIFPTHVILIMKYQKPIHNSILNQLISTRTRQISINLTVKKTIFEAYSCTSFSFNS